MFSNDIALTVIITTLLILLLILGVIVTIVLANRRHIQQEVKMAQLQVTYEQELRKAEQEVQEQVLTNIARDLHDNIGQLLTYINIQVEQGKMSRPDTLPMLSPISDTIQDTILQVRMLSRSLNSDFLENGGLIQGIAQEMKRLQQFRAINIKWLNDETEPALDKNQRIMTFRIFQEIMNNTLKHSGAKEIEVTLQGKGDFSLTVADNGRGFDLAAKREGGGSGLKNMEKRAALANLSFSITTSPGKGSRFALSFS